MTQHSGSQSGAIRWLKPHLFLSYAREDSAFAQVLFRELSGAGFDVYLDVEKTLVGERFHEVITRELRRSDGVVALVSPASAASPWCQAELYYAHALRKTIAPLRLGSESVALAEPLVAIEKSVQYIPVRHAEDYPRASRTLHQQLRTARARRHFRIFSRAAILLAIIAIVIAGWRESIRRINAFTRDRERVAVLQRVHESTSNLTRDAVSVISRQSSDDQQLAATLLLIARDRERSDIERINATIVANALVLPRMPEKRWAIRGLDWHNSDLKRADFTDVTFMTARLNDIRFTDVTFAGVSWNEAPTQEKDGLMLSSTLFDTCRF
jgi:hypothetical protein